MNKLEKKTPSPSDNMEQFPLSDSMPHLIRETYRAFTRNLETRISQYGLSIGSWNYLQALWEEDKLSQTELCERIGVMGPTAVTALERMERAGLIVRERSREDRRRSVVSLTPKGNSLKKKITPEVKAINDVFTAGTTKKEIAALKQTLKTIKKNLEKNSSL